MSADAAVGSGSGSGGGDSASSGEDERGVEGARQLAAQAAAIALHDAAAQLRAVSTLSTAAISVALRQSLDARPEAREALAAANDSVERALANFEKVGKIATELLAALEPSSQ